MQILHTSVPITLTISGTEETIWSLAGTGGSDTYMPRGQLRFTHGGLVSGTGYTHVGLIPLNSKLHLTGSNLDAGASGLGLNIAYSK